MLQVEWLRCTIRRGCLHRLFQHGALCCSFHGAMPCSVSFGSAAWDGDECSYIEFYQENGHKKVFLLMLVRTLSRQFIYRLWVLQDKWIIIIGKNPMHIKQSLLGEFALTVLISLAGQVDQMAIPVVQRGGVRWIRAGWGSTLPWKHTSKALVSAEPRQLLSQSRPGTSHGQTRPETKDAQNSEFQR